MTNVWAKYSLRVIGILLYSYQKSMLMSRKCYVFLFVVIVLFLIEIPLIAIKKSSTTGAFDDWFFVYF